MSRIRTSPRFLAFTLIELLATIVVLGLSTAAVLPVVSSISDASRRATTAARTTHEVSIALERAADILRESGDPTVAGSMLSILSSTEFRLASGAGVGLTGTTLNERTAAGAIKPLARDITRFEVRYLRDDGSTTTPIAQEVHVVEIFLESSDISTAIRVFLRGRMAIP